MNERDVYEVLQVHPAAHQLVIQAAYRVLASMYHPDRDPSGAATRKMAELNSAYAKVRTLDLRDAYDRALKARGTVAVTVGTARRAGPNGPSNRAGCRRRRLRPLQRVDDQSAGT